MTNAEEVLQIIKAIAFSDITDYCEFGPDGLKPKNLEAIDPIKLHALRTYRFNKKGKLVCVALRDNNRALSLLLKMTGGQTRSST